jgi:hypothetical protein
VQAELNVERDKSTRRNSEVNNFLLLIVRRLRHDIQHQAAPSSWDVELDGVCSQLQNAREEPDAERENLTRYDSEVSRFAILNVKHL